ncbi:PIM1 kinase, partial [Polypterus senegalus]|nr:PIM1 kinase [Polypterus senegalus]
MGPHGAAPRKGCRAADWGDAAPLKCREEGRSANKQEDDEFYEDALPPVLDLRLSKTMAVIKDLRDFKKEYRLGKCIGRGGYSAVYKGIRKADKLQDTDPEPIPRELAHLRRVCEAPSCPAIISLLDWLRDSSRIVLVMELPEPCVNLFQFIRQCGGALEEDQARRIFQQVLVAVRHCHARGVFHRDLKTLNILIQTSTEKAKVIDFGSSSSFHDGHYQSFHGTLCLAPPECVQEKGYRAVPTTVWSLGVMLYHMVSGGKTINLPQDPSRGEQPYARPVSAECRDLIQKCLAVSPEQRPTIEEIACHVWLRRDHPGGNSP